MNRSQALRIGLGLFFLSGVFLLPYWLVILLAFLVACVIPYYIEFVFLVVLEEMLYHNTASLSADMLYPMLLIILFVLIEASRNVVRERILRI